MLRGASIVARRGTAARGPLGLASVRHHGGVVDRTAPKVSVTFVKRNGEAAKVVGHQGQDILSLAHEHHIDLEGACEGSVACSTCHVILDAKTFSGLSSPSEDEEDMLDMAYGLTPTSRLGCQVKLDVSMEGAVITLPKATRNFAVDKKVI